MSTGLHPFQSLTAKLHTIHPALVLAPLAIATWVAVPALVIGESSTPAAAAQTQTDAARRGTTTGDAPASGTPPASTVYSVAPVQSPPAAVLGRGFTGAAVANGNAGSNFAGGGTSTSASGSANSEKHPEPPQRHANLADGPGKIPGSPPAHTVPRAVPQPPVPSAAKVPTPLPVAPPPAPPPSAHSFGFFMPPFIHQSPLAFGRPAIGHRMGGGGFARHR
jgi:hypothetical protein